MKELVQIQSRGGVGLTLLLQLPSPSDKVHQLRLGILSENIDLLALLV
jgi:hypothetical protein